jgi:hypothetical protein
MAVLEEKAFKTLTPKVINKRLVIFTSSVHLLLSVYKHKNQVSRKNKTKPVEVLSYISTIHPNKYSPKRPLKSAVSSTFLIMGEPLKLKCLKIM